MPPTKREVTPVVRNLRSGALLVAGLSLVQAALGGTVLSGGGAGMKTIHGYIGYATFVASLIAVFLAYKASQETGNKGTLFHAASLPLIALLQIALGEMDVKWVHVVVGIVFLVAAFGLYAMADRPSGEEKPGQPTGSAAA